MANDIAAGDVVRLKSGGPKMTVEWVEDGAAFCKWFDSKGEAKSGKYSVLTIEKASP